MECGNTCTCIVCRAGMKWTDDPEKVREAIEKLPVIWEREYITKEEALERWPEQ